ncbi:hypothetical protein B0T13DRAFT_460083 [Neurospora crassa]|nr:hypothetical protein B0T13DRAFT_460083 [Neurospora crassa]
MLEIPTVFHTSFLSIAVIPLVPSKAQDITTVNAPCTYYIIVFLSISSKLDSSWLGRVIGYEPQRARGTRGEEVLHVYIR